MTLAAAGVGLAIAGTILNVGGKIAGGIANKRAADYQAGIADLNRQIAEQNAKMALERGQVEQQEQDIQSLTMIGTQEAVQGASGIEVTSGSAVQARAVARRLARLDALRVRENSRLEARAYRTQAIGQQAQATLLRREGRQSLVAGFLGGFSSLISGASRVNDIRRYT